MRVYSTYRNNEFALGFARHLIETLTYSGQDVWLVSPWLKDVRLPLSDLGHFASVLGEHFDELSLSELLARIAERHTLHLVTKPPAEFIPFDQISLLDLKLDQYAELNATEGLMERSVLIKFASSLRNEIDMLVRNIQVHEETYSIGRKLETCGARVYYLKRLHAKVTWTPASAFIGSANFTNGGFYYNDELMIEVTDEKTHTALRSQVQALTRRAQPRARYNLTNELTRYELDELTFLEFANRSALNDYPSLQALMSELSFLIR